METINVQVRDTGLLKNVRILGSFSINLGKYFYITLMQLKIRIELFIEYVNMILLKKESKD